MFGVPPNTLPYIHTCRDILLLGVISLLHYKTSFKTMAGKFNGAFWWYGPLFEDQEKF